jgi:threonine dehydrogenase-like Zn-dependent dehydrogenase
VPDGITDEQALFVSDAVPTGFFGADLAGIEPGDTVAVWGCGGVGQMAIASARILGAERVIAIDRFPDRLRPAAERYGAEIINYEEAADTHEMLMEMTGGRGPDRCIDAVGMEAHSTGPRLLLRQGQDRPVHGDRPDQRAPRRDPRLPQGRDRLGDRRLRRLRRQVPDGRHRQQGAHPAAPASSPASATPSACSATSRRAGSTRRGC